METSGLRVFGRSLIGRHASEVEGTGFHAVNPATGIRLEPEFYSATTEDIDQATNLAADAFKNSLQC